MVNTAPIFMSVPSKSRTAITSHSSFIVVTAISTVVVYAITLWLQLEVFKHGRSDAAVQTLTVSSRTTPRSACRWCPPPSVTRASSPSPSASRSAQ